MLGVCMLQIFNDKLFQGSILYSTIYSVHMGFFRVLIQDFFQNVQNEKTLKPIINLTFQCQSYSLIPKVRTSVLNRQIRGNVIFSVPKKDTRLKLFDNILIIKEHKSNTYRRADCFQQEFGYFYIFQFFHEFCSPLLLNVVILVELIFQW